MIAEKFSKRVFIIHGWDGDVKKSWYPWLKKRLESEGVKVYMPQMPNPANPKISVWINHLKKLVKYTDENTYFIGHSIGCQTILRYLTSNKKFIKIGGAIFISGWFNLKDFAYKENPKLETMVRKIARPWIEKKINFAKIRNIADTNKITYLISDDDYYVDIKNSYIFKDNLGAKIIIQHGKGHYAERDNVKEMPIVVKEFNRMAKI